MERFAHFVQYLFLFLLIHLSRISKFNVVGLVLFWVFLGRKYGSNVKWWWKKRCYKICFQMFRNL